MPITIQWDDTEKTIIRWDFDGYWSWQDFFTAHEKIETLLTEVNYQVSMIADMRRTSVIPSGAPSQFKRVAQLHVTTRTIVVVGANRLVQIMLKLFSRIYKDMGSKILTAQSVNEARALLMHQSPNYPKS